MTEYIQLDKIRTDGGTQARSGLDNVTVTEYKEAMEEHLRQKNGLNQWPDIILYYDGTDYWLADGFHRVAARKLLAGKAPNTISADVRQGTRREAVLYAAGANNSHGLRRTASDKWRAVERLLVDPEWGTWADREIARRCHVSPTFVGRVRSKLGSNDRPNHAPPPLPLPVHVDSGDSQERTYTRQGQTAVMNTAKIGSQPSAEPTEEEINRGLLRACHKMAEAGARWQKRRETGLDDWEIEKALVWEFGLGGASSGPGLPAISFKGGADPSFWYGDGYQSGKPTLRGKALIDAVRELMEIPYPQDVLKGEQTAVSPPVKALSIRQPWAWLIVEGHKDIENRDWATSFRGRCLIHAGKIMRMADYRAAAEFAAKLGVAIPHVQELHRGGIVGVATVTDCVQHSRSPWFFGRYGFVLSEPLPLPFTPCAGQLGFFEVEREVSEELRRWWIGQTAVSQEAP